MTFRLVIPGDPIAWKRPVHRSVGRKHWTFDSQKPEKEVVRLQILSEMNKIGYRKPLEAHGENYSINLYFCIPVPRSDPQIEKNAKLWGIQPANEKPDFDNLTKFYLDCGNGLLWSDDKRIVSGHPKKVYSENPRTIIEIMTKNNLNVPPNVEAILRIFGPSELRELAKHVKQLSYLTEENINDSLGESERPNKDRWLAWTALLLSRLAHSHAGDLKKILKFNVEDELKQMEIEVTE